MKWSIVALIAALPLGAQATAVVVGPPLTGTTTAVNNGTGDHSDPHVSGNICAYSTSVNSAFTVRYQDLTTAVDTVIPNDGTTKDFLSDVSGNTIAFTRIDSTGGEGIYTYVLGAAAPVAIAHNPSVTRDEAQIGANTIAWEEFSSSFATTDIVVFDSTTSAQTRLTNDVATDDGVINQTPALSPDGAVAAWAKCISPSTCDIWTAVRAGGIWTPHQITNGAGLCSHPDTNGQVVTYSCNRVIAGVPKNSLYWQPVAGGSEQSPALAGSQITPSMSGQFIAFASDPSGGSTHDIYVIDISTSTLYQVTNTPEDEQVNDTTVLADGTVRVVWQVKQSTNNLAVYAYTFKVTPPCGGGGDHCHCHCDDHGDDGHGEGHCEGDDGHGDDGHGDGEHCDCEDHGDDHGGGNASGGDCNNPGSRPLLATLHVSREPGQSDDATTTFAATEDSDGLLCLDNGFGGFSATSGDVKLNNRDVVEEDQLEDGPGLIQRRVSLDPHNTLSLDCDRPYGSAYRVRIYGSAPVCSSADLSVAALHVTSSAGHPATLAVVTGTPVTFADSSHLPLSQPAELKGAGCGSIPGGTALSAVLALLAWVSLSRVTAQSRASRRRR